MTNRATETRFINQQPRQNLFTPMNIWKKNLEAWDQFHNSVNCLDQPVEFPTDHSRGFLGGGVCVCCGSAKGRGSLMVCASQWKQWSILDNYQNLMPRFKAVFGDSAKRQTNPRLRVLKAEHRVCENILDFLLHPAVASLGVSTGEPNANGSNKNFLVLSIKTAERPVQVQNPQQRLTNSSIWISCGIPGTE